MLFFFWTISLSSLFFNPCLLCCPLSLRVPLLLFNHHSLFASSYHSQRRTLIAPIIHPSISVTPLLFLCVSLFHSFHSSRSLRLPFFLIHVERKDWKGSQIKYTIPLFFHFFSLTPFLFIHSTFSFFLSFFSLSFIIMPNPIVTWAKEEKNNNEGKTYTSSVINSCKNSGTSCWHSINSFTN